MCLINFHFQQHPVYQLVVVANRDEFYERPTAAAAFWEDDANILAGRDLLQKGTWMGISKEGRFAALTNYRDPRLPQTGRFSRGEIVRTFLSSNIEAPEFIDQLAKTRDDYAGYNVLVGDGNGLFHYNNIFDERNVITAGTHSLSNHTLNTPWPKVAKGKQKLAQYVCANPNELQLEPLFDIVADEEMAPDEALPQTGVSLEWERTLSPLFIKSPKYGTRASTVLLMDINGEVTFVERSFDKGAFHQEKQFTFNIAPK